MTTAAVTSLRYPTALLGAFAAIWLALAIHPWYRQDWLLENMLVFAALPIFVATARRLRFSNFAYTCLFLFLVLHSVGAHYTYSEVPYDRWSEQLIGRPLNDLLGWERNHYDRVVHFAYGLLITPLALELYHAVAPPRGLWRWLMPLLFMVSHSVVYELVEWAAAVVFGGELGVAYLGTQGDVWDAQKDMTLAAAGSVVAILVAAARGALPGTPARLPRHRPEGPP
jgi:putative membrane protein